jgi:hypothetical protein
MHWYLYVLLSVKLIFVFLFFREKVNPSPEIKKRLSYIDNLFILLLNVLILYLFHPFTKNPVCVDKETKMFLFTFGFLTLIHSV